MFTAIASYISKSKVNRNNASRKSQFVNWDKIEKIALIIDDPQINKSDIDKFIDATKKYVEVFYVEPNSKQPSYADWKCYCRKDKTLLNLPKNEVLQSLHSKRFDVSVCVSGKNPLFSANLISAIGSQLNCGNVNLFGELDLIIGKKESQSVPGYLADIQKYLGMIRPGK